jgi:hypothetical protein
MGPAQAAIFKIANPGKTTTASQIPSKLNANHSELRTMALHSLQTPHILTRNSLTYFRAMHQNGWCDYCML